MNIRTTLTVAAVTVGLTLAGAGAASAAGPDDAPRAGQQAAADADGVCDLTGQPADQVRDRLRTDDGTCDGDGDGLCDLTGLAPDQVRDQLRAHDGTGTGARVRQHSAALPV